MEQLRLHDTTTMKVVACKNIRRSPSNFPHLPCPSSLVEILATMTAHFCHRKADFRHSKASVMNLWQKMSRHRTRVRFDQAWRNIGFFVETWSTMMNSICRVTLFFVINGQHKRPSNVRLMSVSMTCPMFIGPRVTFPTGRVSLCQWDTCRIFCWPPDALLYGHMAFTLRHVSL